MPYSRVKIAVAFATSGRSDVLTWTVGQLLNQSRPPDELLVCPASPQDADGPALRALYPDVRIIEGPIGSSAQRNALMAVSQADVIVFLDDDFLPHSQFLEEAEILFSSIPDVVVATGYVLKDGIIGPGLTYEDARKVLDNDAGGGRDVRDVYNAYGCNMLVRLATVRQTGACFDERLPLYGWLEDVDLSRQLAPFGRIVSASALRGVHLGNKTGRSRGKRIGYSQIANPLFLLGKGTLTSRRAAAQIARNLAANLVRSVRPEPWVDRRGRLLGNLKAILDIGRGRLHPQRILEID